MPDATQPTPAPQPAPPLPDWYTQMPRAARTYAQLGFAGVIAVVFVCVVGVVLVMFQRLQSQVADQAREDRSMFREELREQRSELKRAVDAMNAAVERLDAGQRQINRDMKTIKDNVPGEPWKAPQPRAKADEGEGE
jgi:uncharacterized protein HemX